MGSPMSSRNAPFVSRSLYNYGEDRSNPLAPEYLDG